MHRSRKYAIATMAVGIAASTIVTGNLFDSFPSRAVAQQLEAESSRLDGGNTDAFVGAERLSEAFRRTAAKLRPSVVTISAMVKPQKVSLRRGSNGSPLPSELRDMLPEELFEQLQQRQMPIEPDTGIERTFRPQQSGVGSGLIVSSDGYILTNNHVVDEADALEVELSNGRVYDAEVIGTDPNSDVAVLKIYATGLQPVEMGDSSSMQVGDWVLAVGSPFGLSQTVTAGIISATNRQTGIISGSGGYEDFLQTDASINPGNSGGPLVNLRGEVIGINTAINSRSGNDAGVSFAIPSNMAVRVMTDLQKHGKVVRGFIGAALDDITPETAARYDLPDNLRRGAVIALLGEGQPGERAGLKNGDVVTRVGPRQVRTLQDLRSIVAMTRPGATLPFTVYRGGNEVNLEVEVGTKPDEESMRKLLGEFEVPGFGIGLSQARPSAAASLGLRGIESIFQVVSLAGDGAGVQNLELRPGDTILEINGEPIKDREALLKSFEADNLQLTVMRRRRIISLPPLTR